ncbi:hypothetical protein ACJ73_00633 [Blastomyces percursus]|uniref:Uncharacterized protein n=1 Tax=Blastomyces percursus TaxID=1658174 RepID=A0A1J9RHB9_9EURO|nr:hypothetical protein ACJ73_00633 [Blastomyces percursus]
MDSHTDLAGRPENVGNQAAIANHTNIVNHQPNNPRTSGNYSYSNNNTAHIFTTRQKSRLTLQSASVPRSTPRISSQQMSLIEPSLNVSLEESREIQRLLASLEAVERRKRESASQVQMLERE